MLIHNYNKSQIEKKNVLLSSTKNIVAMATKQETLGIYYGSELLIFQLNLRGSKIIDLKSPAKTGLTDNLFRYILFETGLIQEDISRKDVSSGQSGMK